MQVRIQDHKDINEEAVTTTLRRALRFYSTIQAHDGHWPGDYGGPMFLMPGLVSPPTSCQVTSIIP
jgi:cycloartenol synthase